jgi:hypothetical protein
MKHQTLSIVVLTAGLGLLAACTKNSTPPKTIYDTVTQTKSDTIQLAPPDDTPNLTAGLVLYLPFTNGSFADSSGLNNSVTAINGAALGYDMHGYAQSAYTSNGGNAYLEVANNGSYAVDTAFSLSFDFMLRSYPHPGLQDILSLVEPATGNGPTFNLGIYPSSGTEYFLFDVNGSGSSCDSSGASDPSFVWDTTQFTPQMGAWYNAICIFSHGTGSIYINGQMISSRKIGSDSVLFCPNANFIVGGWWSGDVLGIDGEIDEVRMYNRTLTAQQIAWLSRNFQINSTRQRPGLQSGRATTIN